MERRKREKGQRRKGDPLPFSPFLLCSSADPGRPSIVQRANVLTFERGRVGMR